MTAQETGQAIELSHPEGTVTARKVVSQGERLKISTGDEDTKLDALLLESLSWQRDSEAIGTLLSDIEGFDTDPVASTDGEGDHDCPGISISNEYSHVVVSKVPTEAGERLRIETPARGSSIELGPEALRAIAGIEDTFVFSTWFRTPFGPEDTPVEGPL